MMQETKIIDYSPKYEEELLDLFYKSVYSIPTYKNIKGSDYVRLPNRWYDRYTLVSSPIIKILEHKGKLIASLGLLDFEGLIDNKIRQIGFFVDNCIVPEYIPYYKEIFKKLFTDVEKEAREKGFDAIVGWDYHQLPIGENRKLFEELDCQWIEGVRWYIGGNALGGEYPKKWKTKHLGTLWRLGFSAYTPYYKSRHLYLKKLPKDINIRYLENSDFSKVCNLINNECSEQLFAPNYSPKKLREIVQKNNMFGIVAEKESEIVGVLIAFTAAWSGMMFGKPHIDEKWDIILGFLLDEFTVKKEYKHACLPSHMIRELMKIKNPIKRTKRRLGYSMISDVLDIRKDMDWRRKAFIDVGCNAPEVGYGVLIGKSLNNKFTLDTRKIWHIPPRCIVSPVIP